MQQWTLIKSEDIKDYLTVNQQKYLKNLKKVSDATNDVINEIITSVSLHVRAEMKGVYRGRVPQASPSVPHSLKRTTFALILEELQTRFPLINLTADQFKMIEKSHHYLERVSSGKIMLEEIELGDTSQGVAVVSRRMPRVSRAVLTDL